MFMLGRILLGRADDATRRRVAARRAAVERLVGREWRVPDARAAIFSVLVGRAQAVYNSFDRRQARPAGALAARHGARQRQAAVAKHAIRAKVYRRASTAGEG